MILTLKTLQEDSFTVEIDPSKMVRCLKEQIEKVKGQNYPAKNMKLLYGGKFLLDSNRICDYSLEEKKFVIVVIKQPKRPLARGEPGPLEAAFMNGTNSSERDRMLRDNHEMLVQHIVELGFTRVEVEHALRQSYNNPEQAVDFLINNIVSGVSSRTSLINTPLRITPQSGPVLDFADAHLVRQMTEESPPIPSSSSILPSRERILEIFGEAVAECESHTIAQDRMIAADHDHIIEAYDELEAAGITDPHGLLASGALECSSDTYEYLAENQDDEVSACLDRALMEPGVYGLIGQDYEAIDRLKQLGFSEEKVIEAFLVCEKNENAAADYLFSEDYL